MKASGISKNHAVCKKEFQKKKMHDEGLGIRVRLFEAHGI
jgi:hypothetical protein